MMINFKIFQTTNTQSLFSWRLYQQIPLSFKKKQFCSINESQTTLFSQWYYLVVMRSNDSNHETDFQIIFQLRIFKEIGVQNLFS